jgi:hypothetical protein
MIDETNYAQIILDSGFEPILADKKLGYHPDDNFFGVSVYHPDIVLIRNNKQVIISLQGVMGIIHFTKDEYCDDVGKKIGLKFIIFKEDDKIIYKNQFGVFPSREFIRKFCKK